MYTMQFLSGMTVENASGIRWLWTDNLRGDLPLNSRLTRDETCRAIRGHSRTCNLRQPPICLLVAPICGAFLGYFVMSEHHCGRPPLSKYSTE